MVALGVVARKRETLKLTEHIKTHNAKSRCTNPSNTPKNLRSIFSTDSCLQTDNGVSTSNNGGINPDPPATAQLQHAITWKPYGLVPFFGYSTPKACLGVRRTSLTTKNQDEIACDHKEIPYSDANLHFNARVNRILRSSFNTKSGAEE